MWRNVFFYLSLIEWRCLILIVFIRFVLGKWPRSVMISGVRQPSKLPVQVRTSNELSGESVIKELIGLILLSAASFVLLCWQEHLALTEVEIIEHNGLYCLWDEDVQPANLLSVCPVRLYMWAASTLVHRRATRTLTRLLLNCRQESWRTITALLFP